MPFTRPFIIFLSLGHALMSGYDVKLLFVRNYATIYIYILWWLNFMGCVIAWSSKVFAMQFTRCNWMRILVYSVLWGVGSLLIICDNLIRRFSQIRDWDRKAYFESGTTENMVNRSFKVFHSFGKISLSYW